MGVSASLNGSISAEERLEAESVRGDVFVFKTTLIPLEIRTAATRTTSPGEAMTPRHMPQISYRSSSLDRSTLALENNFSTARGPLYSISQRADHIWEGVSSATTRSRPIINSRDEPHADAESFRRLHVIVGDSNMSEYTTFLKIGVVACVLRMLEDLMVSFRDFSLKPNSRYSRYQPRHDLSTACNCNRARDQRLDIQREFLDAALSYADRRGFNDEEMLALQMWEHCISTIEDDPLKLDREIDWVIKYRLIEAFL